MRSIGSGKITVEFFSAEMLFSVCRYRSCRAPGESCMTSAASFKALEAFISPSAATTLALASREASASAAIALCNDLGRLTSLLERKMRFTSVISKSGECHISTLSTLTPQGSVATSRDVCIMWEIPSRSARISDKFRVPRMFLRVVIASSLVELL
jgi:hypothetical protein